MPAKKKAASVSASTESNVVASYTCIPCGAVNAIAAAAGMFDGVCGNCGRSLTITIVRARGGNE